MDAEDEDALHYEMEEEEKKVTVHETVFSRVLRDSTPRFVRRLVGWSVGQSCLIASFACNWLNDGI